MSDTKTTSIYSNTEIREAVKSGHIICNPYNDVHVSQASLDVTLGYYFYRIERLNEQTLYNPFDSEDVERYFEGPFKAMPHDAWARSNKQSMLKGIPADHPVISLKPGERILAHTHEFVGILPPGCCELKARSSYARNGVAVCFDAGFVDPGYINRLTLEIYNLNNRETIVLPVGERIAQLVFYNTGPVEGDYGSGRDKGFSGKYQTGTDLDTIIKIWAPDMMIPRAFLDKRAMPKKIEGMVYD
ncbi:MAG TPA: dCTP deaminase [Candidatus Saccharimonadales bacterium]|nr:dCTP deaminase [Candidatus Saccharimonadales bacterium]